MIKRQIFISFETLMVIVLAIGCGNSRWNQGWNKAQLEAQRREVEQQKQDIEQQKQHDEYQAQLAELTSHEKDRTRKEDEEAEARHAAAARDTMDRSNRGETKMEFGLYGEGTIEGTVLQIIDKENMLVSVPMNDGPPETGWVTGMVTDIYVDGSQIFLHVKVDGRKRYESAFGVRTVPLLRLVAPHNENKN